MQVLCGMLLAMAMVGCAARSPMDSVGERVKSSMGEFTVTRVEVVYTMEATDGSGDELQLYLDSDNPKPVIAYRSKR